MIAYVTRLVALVALVLVFDGSTHASNATSDYVQRESQLYYRDATGREWQVCPGRMIVTFANESSAIDRSSALSRHGLVALDAADLPGGGYRCGYDASRAPLEVLDALRNDSLVERAYLDTKLEFFGSDDEYYAQQWTIPKARVDRAWNVCSGSNEVVIAVLDSGFELLHEDLAGAVWVNEEEANGSPTEDDDGNGFLNDVNGWDFFSDDNNPAPVDPADSHGTCVVGIACAVRNNEVGVAGVAGGEGGCVRFVPVRVHAGGDVAAAIDYAWRLGVDIINMSFGVADVSSSVQAAIDSAHAHGVLLFASSGSIGAQFVYFPASDPDVIAVGSTDPYDERICSSSYGIELDLVAPSASTALCPGLRVWTTDNYLTSYSYNPGYQGCGSFCEAIPADNDKYFGGFGGTSAASPFAAAVAALLKSHMPGLTSAQIRQRLLNAAIDIDTTGFDIKTGWGRVDAYRTVTEWGTISEDVTWGPDDTHDGVRYISGDLTIAEGATLTILPGTIIRVADADDLGAMPNEDLIEINVEGTLVADGTAADPIVFESWTHASSEDWVGFYFDSESGGGTFDHCEISGAEYAIESYVPLTVTNTEIDTCRYAGVVSQDGGALIQNSHFVNPGTYGVFLTEGTSVLRNTVIAGATSAGCHVQPNAVVIARNSNFLECGTGLYVNGFSPSHADSNCNFEGNDVGANFYNTSTFPAVRNSGFEQNTSTAILCDNTASPLIELNGIFDNGDGIYCSNSSSPAIESNQIKICGNAVTATSGANPDVGHYSGSGKNSIAHTTGKYVSNLNASGTIYAQNNCWNVNTGSCAPLANRFQGSVNRSNPICCDFPRDNLIFQLPEPTAKPSVTALLGVVPNPFNPTTTIHYSVASQGTVEIHVYDVAGRFVAQLASGPRSAGEHSAVWNGTDRRGSPVASGVYFVRMAAGGQVFRKKMVLLK